MSLKPKRPWIPAGRSISKSSMASKSPKNEERPPKPSAKLDTVEHKKMSKESRLTSVSPSSSCSSCEELTQESRIYIRSVKHEMRIIKLHHDMLLLTSQNLCRYIMTLMAESMKETFHEVYVELQNFSLEELEYLLTLAENVLFEREKSEQCVKMIKCKEKLIKKILELYGKVVTVYQTILTQHISTESTRISSKNELRRHLEETEKINSSQAAVIKDLERKLSILQGKISTLESFKLTVEEAKRELEKKVYHKEAQNKYLSNELAKLTSQQNESGNEKLLGIIEEISLNFKTEKKALKKELKYHKVSSEEAFKSVQQLKEDITKKETKLFEASTERDRLKLHLTVANNKLIDANSHNDKLKSKIFKFEDQLRERDSVSEQKLEEITHILHEKTSALKKLEKENLKLKEKVEALILKEENDDFRAKKSCESSSQSKSHAGEGDRTDEIKNLINLLQDTKLYLKQGARGSDSQKIVLDGIKELRQELLELKRQSRGESDHENKIETEIERKFGDMKKLYRNCCKENENLKLELDEVKSLRHPGSNLPSSEQHIQANYSDEYSNRNLQMELSLKTEENRRLRQKEKELARELEEVREKLQKKEMQTLKVFSLEEELRTKKKELSLLEQKREEESARYMRRIKELEQSLDQVTTDHESLKRYVQILKSSLHNVFGDS